MRRLGVWSFIKWFHHGFPERSVTPNFLWISFFYLAFFIILLIDDAAEADAGWRVSGKKNEGLGAGSPVAPQILPSGDGRRVYVASIHQPILGVISTLGDAQRQEIQLSAMAHQLVLTPDGKHVIVSHAQSDAVSVICTESLKVVADRVSTQLS